MKNLSLLILLICFCLKSFSQTDTLKIRAHLDKIIKTEKYRNYRNVEVLDNVASYIKEEISNYADSTYYQKYEVDGNEYKNVIGVFGNSKDKTIVIGAHYDVCGDQDGADDNASGIAGLLELARLLQTKKQLKYRYELVAYTLEEPPFFRTENMGSYKHAKSLFDAKKDVYGMLSFDMIGYFNDAKKTQSFPIGMMSWFYRTRANYIMIINKWGKGKFARKLASRLKRQDHIKVKPLSGPKSVEGLDWSDHLNYWNFEYSASMLTDTAGYRNKNYHRKSDTVETLNISKIAKVVDGVFEAILEIK